MGEKSTCPTRPPTGLIMKISVFGGSQPKPDSPAYEEALQLGNLLAQHLFLFFLDNLET